MRRLEEQLHSACSKGNIETVNQLLLNNPQKDLKFIDSTPLYIACKKGYIEIVKLLLNDGRIDINKPNNYGTTPFNIACEKGHIEVIKLLLNNQSVDINKARNNGATPFYIPCQIKGRTPLYYLCKHGDLQSVECILATGREINFNLQLEIQIARERENTEQGWESEEYFQQRKNVYKNIVELLESFQRNPIEIRIKLRIKFGFPGNFFFFNIIFF